MPKKGRKLPKKAQVDEKSAETQSQIPVLVDKLDDSGKAVVVKETASEKLERYSRILGAKISTQKEALLIALEKNMGIGAQACRMLGINRGIHQKYLETDPDYKKAVMEMRELVLDFAEHQLFNRINEGSDTATIFLLKCLGKKRGYREKEDAPEASPTPINIMFNHVPVSDITKFTQG